MMETDFVVLYTHQKQKKAKTWHDGHLKHSGAGTKASLYDEKGRKLDSIHIKVQDISLGEQLESDRYYILVEELHQPTAGADSQSTAQLQVNQQDVNTCTSLPGSAVLPGTQSQPRRVGLKRKLGGFRPPRMTSQQEASCDDSASMPRPSHSGNQHAHHTNSVSVEQHRSNHPSSASLFARNNSSDNVQQQADFSNRLDAVNKVSNMYGERAVDSPQLRIGTGNALDRVNRNVLSMYSKAGQNSPQSNNSSPHISMSPWSVYGSETNSPNMLVMQNAQPYMQDKAKVFTRVNQHVNQLNDGENQDNWSFSLSNVTKLPYNNQMHQSEALDNGLDKQDNAMLHYDHHVHEMTDIQTHRTWVTGQSKLIAHSDNRQVHEENDIEARDHQILYAEAKNTVEEPIKNKQRNVNQILSLLGKRRDPPCNSGTNSDTNNVSKQNSNSFNNLSNIDKNNCRDNSSTNVSTCVRNNFTNVIGNTFSGKKPSGDNETQVVNNIDPDPCNEMQVPDNEIDNKATDTIPEHDRHAIIDLERNINQYDGAHNFDIDFSPLSNTTTISEFNECQDSHVSTNSDKIVAGLSEFKQVKDDIFHADKLTEMSQNNIATSTSAQDVDFGAFDGDTDTLIVDANGGNVVESVELPVRASEIERDISNIQDKLVKLHSENANDNLVTVSETEMNNTDCALQDHTNSDKVAVSGTGSDQANMQGKTNNAKVSDKVSCDVQDVMEVLGGHMEETQTGVAGSLVDWSTEEIVSDIQNIAGNEELCEQNEIEKSEKIISNSKLGKSEICESDDNIQTGTKIGNNSNEDESALIEAGLSSSLTSSLTSWSQNTMDLSCNSQTDNSELFQDTIFQATDSVLSNSVTSIPYRAAPVAAEHWLESGNTRRKHIGSNQCENTYRNIETNGCQKSGENRSSSLNDRNNLNYADLSPIIQANTLAFTTSDHAGNRNVQNVSKNDAQTNIDDMWNRFKHEYRPQMNIESKLHQESENSNRNKHEVLSRFTPADPATVTSVTHNHSTFAGHENENPLTEDASHNFSDTSLGSKSVKKQTYGQRQADCIPAWSRNVSHSNENEDIWGIEGHQEVQADLSHSINRKLEGYRMQGMVSAVASASKLPAVTKQMTITSEMQAPVSEAVSSHDVGINNNMLTIEQAPLLQQPLYEDIFSDDLEFTDVQFPNRLSKVQYDHDLQEVPNVWPQERIMPSSTIRTIPAHKTLSAQRFSTQSTDDEDDIYSELYRPRLMHHTQAQNHGDCEIGAQRYWYETKPQNSESDTVAQRFIFHSRSQTPNSDAQFELSAQRYSNVPDPLNSGHNAAVSTTAQRYPTAQRYLFDSQSQNSDRDMTQSYVLNSQDPSIYNQTLNISSARNQDLAGQEMLMPSQIKLHNSSCQSSPPDLDLFQRQPVFHESIFNQASQFDPDVFKPHISSEGQHLTCSQMLQRQEDYDLDASSKHIVVPSEPTVDCPLKLERQNIEENLCYLSPDIFVNENRNDTCKVNHYPTQCDGIDHQHNDLSIEQANDSPKLPREIESHENDDQQDQETTGLSKWQKFALSQNSEEGDDIDLNFYARKALTHCERKKEFTVLETPQGLYCTQHPKTLVTSNVEAANDWDHDPANVRGTCQGAETDHGAIEVHSCSERTIQGVVIANTEDNDKDPDNYDMLFSSNDSFDKLLVDGDFDERLAVEHDMTGKAGIESEIKDLTDECITDIHDFESETQITENKLEHLKKIEQKRSENMPKSGEQLEHEEEEVGIIIEPITINPRAATNHEQLDYEEQGFNHTNEQFIVTPEVTSISNKFNGNCSESPDCLRFALDRDEFDEPICDDAEQKVPDNISDKKITDSNMKLCLSTVEQRVPNDKETIMATAKQVVPSNRDKIAESHEEVFKGDFEQQRSNDSVEIVEEIVSTGVQVPNDSDKASDFFEILKEIVDEDQSDSDGESCIIFQTEEQHLANKSSRNENGQSFAMKNRFGNVDNEQLKTEKESFDTGDNSQVARSVTKLDDDVIENPTIHLNVTCFLETEEENHAVVTTIESTSDSETVDGNIMDTAEELKSHLQPGNNDVDRATVELTSDSQITEETSVDTTVESTSHLLSEERNALKAAFISQAEKEHYIDTAVESIDSGLQTKERNNMATTPVQLVEENSMVSSLVPVELQKCSGKGWRPPVKIRAQKCVSIDTVCRSPSNDDHYRSNKNFPTKIQQTNNTVTSYSDQPVANNNDNLRRDVQPSTRRIPDFGPNKKFKPPMMCRPGQVKAVIDKQSTAIALPTSSTMMKTKSSQSISSEALCFPSKIDIEAIQSAVREVYIPHTFTSVSVYKQVIIASLTEYMNCQLFDVAKRYQHALSKVDIHTYSQTQKKNNISSNRPPTNSNPSCKCGMASKLVTVKKEGPNKDRCFFACSANRNLQCKFFQWADENRPTGAVAAGFLRPIHDSNMLNSYMKDQGVHFYGEAQLIRRTANYNIKKYFKTPKWAHGKGDGEAIQKKQLFLKLPYKGRSSLYAKDDIWCISTSLGFEAGSTFLARSTFYGPSSSLEVEIEPLTGYSSSNWTSGTVCHAILAGNGSSELSCIDNIREHLQVQEPPVISHLLNKHNEDTVDKQFTTGFQAPRAVANNSNIYIPSEQVSCMARQYIEKYRLNVDQTEAMWRVANMFSQEKTDRVDSVLLIHGVFGAGKSFLLSVMVLFLVELFHANTSLAPQHALPWKLLISSTTNVAVDRILIGLLELGFEDFVRVGSVKKIAKPVLPFSVHASGTDNQELKDLQEMLRSGELSNLEKSHVRKSIEKHRCGENKKMLSRVRVVGTTCASASLTCLNKMCFPLVMLDECSQMTEPASLLPVARFFCQKLLLVGDPKQLNPTLQGAECAHDCGLEQTLFNRLVKMGSIPTLLRTQYRCHPYISAAANNLFYGGMLEDGISQADRKPLMAVLPTMCCYNVERGEECCQTAASYYNDAEAQFVVFLLKVMLSSRIETERIGVITLYRAQLSRINDLIAVCGETELNGVLVSTVDAFQGGERDIIILSTVRTNGCGFIDNNKRTNVALTRARRHLLIVGHHRNLSTNLLWGKIIKHCEQYPNGIQCADSAKEVLEQYTRSQADADDHCQQGKPSRNNSPAVDVNATRAKKMANSRKNSPAIGSCTGAHDNAAKFKKTANCKTNSPVLHDNDIGVAGNTSNGKTAKKPTQRKRKKTISDSDCDFISSNNVSNKRLCNENMAICSEDNIDMATCAENIHNNMCDNLDSADNMEALSTNVLTDSQSVNMGCTQGKEALNNGIVDSPPMSLSPMSDGDSLESTENRTEQANNKRKKAKFSSRLCGLSESAFNIVNNDDGGSDSDDDLPSFK